jgi:ABC-type transport system involved in cytochrome bd biosynthesis fused ATPase/permease subunit
VAPGPARAFDHLHASPAEPDSARGSPEPLRRRGQNATAATSKKVVIAKLLVRQPDLIFDEPTCGVDVAAIVDIHEPIDQECESPICEGVNSPLNAYEQS